MDEIHILQLGEKDWNDLYTLPETVYLDHINTFSKTALKSYDLFFLDRTPLEEEINPLYEAVKAYTLFVTERVNVSGKVAWLCKCKKAQKIEGDDIQRFLWNETRYYYPKPYGDKFSLRDLAVAQGFSGKVKWDGNYSVTLEGEFGDDFRQVAFWRYNSFLEQGQLVDLWLEYWKEPKVSLSLVITQFAYGSADHILQQWYFDENELQQIMQIEGQRGNGSMFASLHARGNGKLKIVALHKRISRGNHGFFLPGGERYVTTRREEAFCYFDPGDLKPPLNVYFSGYKTKQGFEGYNLMKNLGSPFLLVAESRLEGGGFYMGSREYERLFVNLVKKYMEELGFTADQVILSGISMGTYGALYYGCDIKPHAMILGKPLASIGNVAANEKYLRPGGFSTSLDVLLYQSGGLGENTVTKLNDRFWNKFSAVDWGRSKFIVSYMLEDDYDADAYATLLSHLQSEGVRVYGKGIHGRHNDNTPAIVNWFVGQFEKVLREDFSRRIKNK